MKELYQEPSVKVVEISCSSVIATSGDPVEDWGGAGEGGGSLGTN